MRRIPGGSLTASTPRLSSAPPWWVWLLLGFPLLLAGFGAFANAALTQAGGTSEAPCREAVRFAKTQVPERATGATCESYGATDRTYKGTWRMPRADVDAWLDTYFPDRLTPEDPAFRQYADCGASLCVAVLREPNGSTTAGAYSIGADVTYEADAMALVSFSATDY